MSPIPIRSRGPFGVRRKGWYVAPLPAAPLLVLVPFLLVVTACGSGTTPTDAGAPIDTAGSFPDAVAPNECTLRCTAKVGGCDLVPDSAVAPTCAGFCGREPVESQLLCLEFLDCSELARLILLGGLRCGYSFQSSDAGIGPLPDAGGDLPDGGDDAT